MPIYEYASEERTACGLCRAGFERLERLSDPPLDHCPACGCRVRRIISAPSLNRSDQTLDKSNLERHGFTQYRRSGKGEYEKTAGRGPKTLRDDGS